MADVLKLDPEPAPEQEAVLRLDPTPEPVLTLDPEPSTYDVFNTAVRRGTADVAAFVARHPNLLTAPLGGQTVIADAVKNVAQNYADKTREYYPDLTTDSLPKKGVQFVASALPVMMAGPAAPAVAGAQSAEQEFQRAKSRGATDAQAGASEAVSGIVGAATGLIPMKIAAGPTQAVKDVLANAAINAGQQLTSNVGAKVIYNRDQNLGEGVGTAAAVGAAIPTVMHGAKALAVKTAPRPVIAQDVAQKLQGIYGPNAVQMAGNDAVHVRIPDGRKILFRLTDDVSRSSDPAQFAKNMLESVAATNKGAHDAAMLGANGDPVKAAQWLWDDGWKLAGSTRGPDVMVTGPDGSGVKYDTIVDLAAGKATKGTLAHEELHALVKLAKIPSDRVAEWGGEEGLAKILERANDHPVRAFVRRFAEKIKRPGDELKAGSLKRAEDLVAEARQRILAATPEPQQPTMDGVREQAQLAGMERPIEPAAQPEAQAPAAPVEVPDNGTSPAPEFQGLEKARREFALPQDIKGKLTFKRSDRKMTLEFEDPVDEAVYRMGELAKRDGISGMAAADRVRRILEAKAGLTQGQMAQHLIDVRAAVSHAVEAAAADDMAGSAKIARQPIGAETREPVQFMDRGNVVTDEAGTVWRVTDRRRDRNNDTTFTLRDAAGNEKRVPSETGFFKATAAQEAAAPAMPEPPARAAQAITEPEPVSAKGKMAEPAAVPAPTPEPIPEPPPPPVAGTPEAMRQELDSVEAQIDLAMRDFNADSMSRTRKGLRPNVSKYESNERWGDLEQTMTPLYERAAALRQALGIADETSLAAAHELESIIDPPDDLPFAVYREKKPSRGMRAPNLSLLTTDPQARQAVASLDQMLAREGFWKQQMDMQATREQAEAAVAADPAERSRILKLRFDPSSADEQFKASRVLNDALVEGLNDATSWADATRLHVAMRADRRELARALAAGRDQVAGPALRQQMLTKALNTYSPELEARLQSTDVATAQKAMAEARRQYDEILEQWKQEGTLIQAPVTPAPEPAPMGGLDVVTRPTPETPAGAPPVAPDGANPMGPQTTWVLNPEVLADPAKAASVLRDLTARRSTAGLAVFEVYRNSILATAKGWTANALSGFNAVRDLTVNRWAEATINEARRAFGKNYDPGAANWADIARAYRDLWPVVVEASRNLVQAFRTETSRFDDPFWEGNNFAIRGKTGRFVRIPQRINMAADEFFMTLATRLNERMMARGLAEAEGRTGADLETRTLDLMLNPPEALRAKALERAQLVTFKAPLGFFAKGVMRFRDGKMVANTPNGQYAVDAASLLTKMIFPFVKTPVNVMKQGLRMSPFGIVRTLSKAMMDPAYRAGAGELTRDLAENLVSMAATAYVYGLMEDDEQGRPRITGSSAGWRDAGRRDFNNQVIPPTSIRIGDKWYSYARLDPLATSLQATVDALDLFRNANGEDPAIGTRAWQTASAMVRDKTFLQQLDNIMQAMDDPEKSSKILESMAAGFVPTVIKDAIKSQQEAVPGRFTDQGGPAEGADFFDRTLAKALPIPLLAPPQKLDRTGAPMWKSSVFANPLMETLYRIAVPVEVRNAPSMVNEERMLWNYYRARPGEHMPQMPPDTFVLDGVKYRMTEDEYPTFVRLRHQMAMQLASQRGMGFNVDSPTPDDIIRYKAVLEDGGRIARQALIRHRIATTNLRVASR